MPPRCLKCPTGYLTPPAMKMCGMPWECGDCGAKVGHASVVELLLVLFQCIVFDAIREKSVLFHP